MRLGRLPTPNGLLATAPQRTMGLEAAPEKVQHPDFQPGLFQNNDLPDCTAVGLANGINAVSHIHGFGTVIEEDKVPAFFAASVGVPDTTEAMQATDGAIMVDVLAYQLRHGFNVGPQSLVATFANISTGRNSLSLAMWKMGCVYLGVDLYDGDLQADVWSTDYEPGEIVGGHCILGYDYDAEGVRVATWGGWKRATWDWWRKRGMEAHVLAWPQLLPAGHSSVFDHNTLLADCQAFANRHVA